jgi:hypothetical protein
MCNSVWFIIKSNVERIIMHQRLRPESLPPKIGSSYQTRFRVAAGEDSIADTAGFDLLILVMLDTRFLFLVNVVAPISLWIKK